RPAVPLVVERNAVVDHRAPLGQEDVLDRPVEAAGRAHAGHVPAALDDPRFRAREEAAPEDRAAVRTAPRPVAVENLEAAEHPGALLAPGAERPATRDPVAAVDRDRASASHDSCARDDRVGAVSVKLLDALVRQPERDELADAVVGHVPAGRAGCLGEQLDDAYVRQRVYLMTAQGARDDHAVEPGGVKLLDQHLRQALLALELVVMATNDRLQSRRRPHERLTIDVSWQAILGGDLSHGADVPLAEWRCQGVLSCP